MSHRTRLWRFRHFVTRFINPITRRVAGWLPGFGVLTYPGRKSERTYHTPVNVFRRGHDYVFVLTYGSDSDWVKNVLAAGECWIRVRGRDVRLTHPKVIADPTRSLVPAPIRFIGGLGNVTEFLRMQAEAASAGRSPHTA
jgi:deazaflavin-dependent oxidoreductase (nitroreductase family)